MAPGPLGLAGLTAGCLLGEHGPRPGYAGQTNAAGALVDTETLIGNGDTRERGLGCGDCLVDWRTNLERRDGVLG